MRAITLPLFSLLIAILTGCTTTHTVRVDGIATATPPENRDYVLEKAPDTEGGQLVYEEASRYIHRMMQSQGYREALSHTEANYLISVNYGQKEPRERTVQEREPLYGYVGGYYRTVRTRVPDGSGGTAIVRRQVYEPSRREIIGYTTSTRSVTEYPKFMTLLATTPDRSRELWQATAELNNTSDDLRYYLPVFVSALSDVIGENTGQKLNIRIAENDPLFLFIKTGSNEETN